MTLALIALTTWKPNCPTLQPNFKRRHDIRPNDTWYNGTPPIDVQNNDISSIVTVNRTLHKVELCHYADFLYVELCYVIVLSFVMLSFVVSTY
jgi:hypothetical protein